MEIKGKGRMQTWLVKRQKGVHPPDSSSIPRANSDASDSKLDDEVVQEKSAA